MRRISAFGGVTILALLFIPRIGQAGWMVTSQIKDKGGAVRKEEICFERNRIRKDGESSTSMADFASRKVIWINKREKVYGEMGIDEFKEMVREGVERTRKGKDVMRRAGFDDLPNPASDKAGAEVTPIGGATVAGYSCDGFQVSVKGVVKEEICIARDLPVVQEVGSAAWKELGEIMREEGRMEFGFQSYAYDPAYKALMQEGYPMRIVDREDGSSYEVIEVKPVQISPALFAAPDGYRKLSSNELRGEEGNTISVTKESFPKAQGEMREHVEQRRTETDAADGPDGRNRNIPAQVVAGGESESVAENGKQPEESGDIIDRAVDTIVDGAWEGIKSFFKR